MRRSPSVARRRAAAPGAAPSAGAVLAAVAAALLAAVVPPATAPVRAEEAPPALSHPPDVVPVVRPSRIPPPPPAPGEGPPTVPALGLWEAERLHQAGRADEALERFLDLVVAARDDERKGFAWMRIAQIRSGRGDDRLALEAVEKSLALTRARSLVLAVMDLKLRIHQKDRQFGAARDVAEYLLRDGYAEIPPADLHAAMARADAALGRTLPALSEYGKAIGAAADPALQGTMRLERDLYVDTLRGLPALREAAETEEDPELKAHLYHNLGVNAFRSGFPGLAVFSLRKAAGAGGGWGREAAARLAEVEASVAGRPRIVGLLPLSGRFAGIGFDVLAGAEIALARYRAPGSGDGIPVLLWEDTGGEAERARALFPAAAGNGPVLAVLGPLTGEEGRAVASAAGPKSPPVLYLGQKEVPAKPFVYPFGLSPAQEARALLRHLARSGTDNVLLFHPDSGYGRGYAEAAAAAASEAGVRIVKTVPYPPDTSDFTAPIRKAVGEKAFQQFARLKEKGTAMELKAQAVVIADQWERVFLLASQLRHYNVYLPLAGFSGWFDDRLLAKAGDAVEGAVFTADYGPALRGAVADDFRTAWRKEFEEEPSRFAAIGYDAATLVVLALGSARSPAEDASADAPPPLRQRIPALGAYGGVTGAFEFGPQGDVRRGVHLIGIELGRFVPLPGT